MIKESLGTAAGAATGVLDVNENEISTQATIQIRCKIASDILCTHCNGS